MSDGVRVAGSDDDELEVTFIGGSQSRDRNTDEARFRLTAKADRELSLSERKEILNRLLDTELALDLENDQ